MTDKKINYSILLNWPYEHAPSETDEVTPFMYLTSDKIYIWKYYDRYSECEIEYRPATDIEIIMALESKLIDLFQQQKKDYEYTALGRQIAIVVNNLISSKEKGNNNGK